MLINERIVKNFWKNVEKTHSCWLWKRCLEPDGYGRMYIERINGKDVRSPVHRVSYEINKGKIPKGLLVLHKCDVRNCVNPKHLFLGTQLDNMRDRNAKGRANRSVGEQLPQSKLDNKKVNKIRKLYKLGKKKQVELAKMFNVNQSVISRAINRKNWKHLTNIY